MAVLLAATVVVSVEKEVVVRVSSASEASTEVVGVATMRDDKSCDEHSSSTLCRPPLWLVMVVATEVTVVDVVFVTGVVAMEMFTTGVVVTGVVETGVVISRVVVASVVVTAIALAVVINVVVNGLFQPCKNEQFGFNGSGGGDLVVVVSVDCCKIARVGDRSVFIDCC